MQTVTKFNSEVTTIQLGSKTIKLESLTPVLAPNEKKQIKRDIENQLYSVFIKYEKSSDTAV